MAIEVIENDDRSLTITWDENDPLESILNTWTEQDFIDAIMERCNYHNGSLPLKDTFSLGDK